MVLSVILNREEVLGLPFSLFCLTATGVGSRPSSSRSHTSGAPVSHRHNDFFTDNILTGFLIWPGMGWLYRLTDNEASR